MLPEAIRRIGVNGRVQDLRIWQGLLALLLFCALFMRLAVPTGYMPGTSDGRATLILCSAFGSREMTVDFGKADNSQKQAGDSSCLFAASLGGGLLPPTFLSAATTPLLVGSLVVQRAIADLTPHRLAAPPPPALGPPLRS